MFNRINCYINNIFLYNTTKFDFIRYVCIERGDNLQKKTLHIIALLLIAVSTLANHRGCYGDLVLPDPSAQTVSARQGDSIMRLVIEQAAKYQATVSRYEAEIYIKGRTEILKQNVLMRFAHHLFPVDRKTKDMVFEMVSSSKFHHPNNYQHKFEAINGSAIPNKAKQKEVLTFLNLNVYSPTIYNEGIIMPVAYNASKYYEFTLDSILNDSGLKVYQIRFMPKLWSQKLICGNLFILDKSWSIDKIDLNGRFSFAEFNLVMTFGRDFRHFLLPETADLSLRYHTLGNAVATSYHSAFKYKEVEWVEEDNESKKWKSLDLTGYYRLSADTIPIVTDSAYWKTKRDLPFTEEEQQLYRQTSGKITQNTDTGNIRRYLKITEKLTNTINLDYKTTRLKYSGILNPFQLGYSGRNGITYRQKLRLSKTFERDRQLRFRPVVGYVFKRKELFFTLAGDWEYLPERQGTLSLSAGNGNQGYSSEITKKINEQLKDSTFNFDDLNLEYFKHYYIELRNDIELFNGFQLMTSLSYHRRIPVKNKSDMNVGDDVTDIINENYHDFTPTIGLSYTPRQYYWMDGYRKEYLYSFYPTISLEVARGIPGIWKSSGDYCRIEADLHQSIYLGLSRRFNYHISGGMYTKQKSTYFADFRYFARRNFPESWEDRFGGVFNELKGEWFNASDEYVQAHFMYESPFMLVQLFKPKASKYILQERFYLSQLWLPVMPSYTELGYGFGNNLFNVAVFAGFRKLNYQSIGVKFTFELFQ